MGLFSFFKKKKKKEKETATAPKKLTPSSKIGGNEELSVPEYDNSFTFSRPEKKGAVETSSAKRQDENKKPVSKKKPKTASPQKTAEKEVTKANSATPEGALRSEGSKDELDAAIARTGKFEIKKTKDDRYVFNLYASNHVIVATSQVYSSPQSAITGIKSVVANASKAGIEDQTLKNYTTLPYPKWEIYLDNGNQYRFRLSASNGSCVCHSQGYTKKSNCKSGIESIQKFAPTARIDKAYIKKPSDT